ncbi:hypothetical protein [Chondromyces crocatus]|uniref:hypothetical protein n=1 Tax=Chondromyces crocatus TaxID=52 RepID=UPI001FE09ECA|nr:hypothetical protein [Chondromyces crocatus]
MTRSATAERSSTVARELLPSEPGWELPPTQASRLPEPALPPQAWEQEARPEREPPELPSLSQEEQQEASP